MLLSKFYIIESLTAHGVQSWTFDNDDSDIGTAISTSRPNIEPHFIIISRIVKMKRSPLMVNHTISHWWYHAVKDSLDNWRSLGHHLFIPGWVSDSILHCFRSGNMLKVRICKKWISYTELANFMEDEQKRQERKVVVYWELFVIKQKAASLGRTKSKLQIYAAWPPQQSVIETKHLNNTWI